MYIKKEDLTGRKFGRLVVISEAEPYVSQSGRSERMCLCKCECGNTKIVRVASLRKGDASSCGCLRSEKSRARMMKYKPEVSKKRTKLRGVWWNMMSRCFDKNNKSYKNYGAVGITVCEEWKCLEAFIQWGFDSGYKFGLTLDRIDSKQGYFPENCRWADRITQNNNTSRNHLIEYNGVTKTMAQWSRDTGISYAALKSRLNKHHWSIERALTTP